MKSVIPVGLLLVALVVLGTLQYQWIGQITQIERQKLRSGLIILSSRFAGDFAAEQNLLFRAFDRSRYSGDASRDAATLVNRYREWAPTAPHSNLLKTLYLVDTDTTGAGGLRLRQIYFERELAEPLQWPADMTNLQTALEKEMEPPPSRGRGRGGSSPLRYRPGPGDAMVLVINMMTSSQSFDTRGSERAPRGSDGRPPERSAPRGLDGRQGERGPRESGSGAKRPSAWVIARLDRDAMTDDILPLLAERHFPHNDGTGYRLAVVEPDDNFNQVYATSGLWSQADLESPDHQIDLFGYSPYRPASAPPAQERGNRGGEGPGRGGGPGPGGEGPGRGGPGPGRGGGGPGGGGPGGNPGGPGGPGGGPGGFGGRGFDIPGSPQSSSLGHWRLLVKNELGSLDAAVEQLRRRNLGVSFGVLIVLSAAALTLVFSGQRARALGKLQMEFAAGVSHELRTPLTVIQSAAHNLRSGVVRDPKNVEQYAEIVQKEARRLSGMVEQVMAYAETQSGRRRYDITAVDVTDIIDQALKTLAFVDDVEVKVERRILSDLPTALADPVALSQCLQNLISNAVKYGQRDGVVEMDIEALHDTTTGRIRLSVMDRGTGVPATDVPHLFDAFHRGSNVSTSTPGNGIGLHLVRKTIESQNGAVTYSDRPGGGSVFTLTIPSAESRA